MKKLYTTSAAILLSAALFLGGCAERENAPMQGSDINLGSVSSENGSSDPESSTDTPSSSSSTESSSSMPSELPSAPVESTEDGKVTKAHILDVYCPSANDDPHFPFYLDIEVDPDSIHYVELDKPVYGFDSLLDRSALDFDVKFSLKDRFKYFDNFKFKVLNSDYSEEIYFDSLSSDEVVTLPGLSLGKNYKINVWLETETLTYKYSGMFTVQVELDSTLSADLFYQLGGIEGDNAPFVEYIQSK